MFFLCVSDHLYHHFVDIPPVSAGVSYQCGAAAARWQGGRGDLIQLSYGNVTTFDMGGEATIVLSANFLGQSSGSWKWRRNCIEVKSPHKEKKFTDQKSKTSGSIS